VLPSEVSQKSGSTREDKRVTIRSESKNWINSGR